MNNLRYGVEEAGADQCQFVLTVGEAIKDVYPDEIDVDSLKTDEEILSANGIEITKVDVTGLPAGITCKNGEFDGKPTKAGVYVMTFTVSYTYIDDPSKTYKSTATAFFRVNDIDATAVGTFNGGVFDAETTNALGTISATISAKGELTSCKIINLEGKSTTIKLQTQSLLDKKEFYSIEGEDADGNDYCFKLYPAGEAEGPTNQLGGVLCAELSGDKVAFASQNVWSDKYYKTLGWLPDVNGEEKKLEEEGLTLKFKSAGAVTAIREGESSSARFELVTCEVADEDVAVGWTGVMTVNIPDWDEGYCESFKVTIVTEDGEDIISDVSKIQ